MQIVIEISEEDYKLIKSYEKDSTNYRISLNLYDAVKNGVPLPEHHGYLIDRQALIDNGIKKRFCNWYDEIKYANPVIEAEGSESE